MQILLLKKHLVVVGNCCHFRLDLVNNVNKEPSASNDKAANGSVAAESDRVEEDETIEDIAHRMSADLRALNKVNNARASFLESVARASLARRRDAKKRSSEELSLINRCQQLLKKSKDMKVKPAKPRVVARDEYALPW